jgi:hypothetical protein
MTDFGDKQPEDAYDATDPPDVRLEVLERVVDSLEELDVGPARLVRRDDALRLVANLAALVGHTGRVVRLHDRLQAL